MRLRVGGHAPVSASSLRPVRQIDGP